MVNATAQRLQNFVGGAYVEGVASFEKHSPVDGSLVALVEEAGAEQVGAAVAAARRAVDGAWGRSTVAERAALLRRIADRIEARFEEFVAAEVADTGKPLRQARELDVARAVVNFRSFADTVSATGLDSFLTELADGRRALNYAVPRPLGVVAIVVPWNLPLLLLTWKVAPALACGNAVVVKPSEETPSTATLLAEVIAEAGAPDGVYNVVHGFGPGSAGELLTTHPDIDGVTFTGESATGAAIMRGVAPFVRPVSFELGGKNAAVVFADADLDKAVAGLGRSIFTNTGQVCLCTERVYIERPVYDEVVAGLVEHAGACAWDVPRTRPRPPDRSSPSSTAPRSSATSRRRSTRGPRCWSAAASRTSARTSPAVPGSSPRCGPDCTSRHERSGRRSSARSRH